MCTYRYGRKYLGIIFPTPPSLRDSEFVNFTLGLGERRKKEKGEKKARFVNIVEFILWILSRGDPYELTQDHKGLFKACNGAECKDHLKSKPYLINRTNGENSRCIHAWFKVSSPHKTLTLKSNKTPHFS
ncbi:hypothetical protein H5410_050367 [Solanum commersonii]|uniref:Uncharacterized protein n=1 Tax=Solanum commersonii TaxID=4109 RepID=A0A9J5WXE7_SOLCO|nr:hypothetical protein H5410_050367 [Solanum commersonii]